MILYRVDDNWFANLRGDKLAPGAKDYVEQQAEVRDTSEILEIHKVKVKDDKKVMAALLSRVDSQIIKDAVEIESKSIYMVRGEKPVPGEA